MGKDIIAVAGEDDPRGDFCRLIKRLALAWINEEHPYVKRINDILLWLLPFILSLGTFIKARSKAEEKELQGAAEITYALALIGSTAPKGKRMATGIYTLISMAAFGRNILNQQNVNLLVSTVAVSSKVFFPMLQDRWKKILPLFQAILKWLCGGK